MAWPGFFSYGEGETEQEFINVTRTEAYARNSGLRWFKPVYNSELLPTLLLEPAYQTPEIDNAPWYDPDTPASGEFFGFYPLNVTGLEDSTRTSQVVESTFDGGIPGRLRFATKAVVFNGLLIASSARGVEYGFRWLNRTTTHKPCIPTRPNSLGYTLHYLSVDPSAEGGCAEWVTSVRAAIDGGYFLGSSDVSVDEPQIDGGGVGGEDVIDGGGPGITDGGGHLPAGGPGSTATLVADGGSPSASGGTGDDVGTLIFDGGTPSTTGGVLYTSTPPFELPAGYVPTPLNDLKRTLRKVKINNGPTVLTKSKMSDGGAVWNVQMTGVAGTPWEFGNPIEILTDFNGAGVTNPYAPGITGGVFDQTGVVYHDVACPQPLWTPVYNPNCPPVSAPPTVPIVSTTCFPIPSAWLRRRASIPSQYIPLWGDVVPVVSVTAPPTDDLATFRMRFYADPTGSGDPADDPCEYVGDYIVSYVPAGTTLVFDGVAERIYILDGAGNQRGADSLVSSSNGGPFDWPQLSCGYGYIVTFDQSSDDTIEPVIDLAIVPRAS